MKEMSRTKQVMKVPNEKFGWDLIRGMRIFLQPGKKIVLRGRSPKPSKACSAASACPIIDCNEIEIYIEEK